MSTTARVLSPQSEAAAVNRIAPPKRGYLTIFRTYYSTSQDSESIEIPSALNSEESLEFCGFDVHASARIYEAWELFQQTPGEPGHGSDIINEARNYVKATARQEGDASSPHPKHEWRWALTGMGAKDRLCDAILNSRVTDVRKARGVSAQYWFLDSLDLAWEFLQYLDERIRNKARFLQTYAQPPDRETLAAEHYALQRRRYCPDGTPL